MRARLPLLGLLAFSLLSVACERKQQRINVRQATGTEAKEGSGPIEPDASPPGEAEAPQGTVHQGVLGPDPKGIFDNVKGRMKKNTDLAKKRLKEQGVE